MFFQGPATFKVYVKFGEVCWGLKKFAVGLMAGAFVKFGLIAFIVSRMRFDCPCRWSCSWAAGHVSTNEEVAAAINQCSLRKSTSEARIRRIFEIFYSILYLYVGLAFEWQRGCRWPCFDTDFTGISEKRQVEGSVKYIWFDMHFKKCINTILKHSYSGREDISLVVQRVVKIFCSFTWYMWPKD